MLALEAQEVEAVLMQKSLTSRGKQAAVAALRQARLRWEAAGDAAPTPQKRTAFPDDSDSDSDASSLNSTDLADLGLDRTR